MSTLQIRAMTPADIDPVAAIYRAGSWGERRLFLESVLSNSACKALVGICDGAVTATGMATVNGRVGWVGSIFVDVSQRSRGFGRAMTEAVCAEIDAAGCTTQALIASRYGRPLYEKMGFRADGAYQILEAPTLGASPAQPHGTSVRHMTRDDLGRLGELDARATGEDRRALLAPMVGSGWVLESGADLLGYLVQIWPESAALVATEREHALFLLDLLRYLGHGRTDRARAAVHGEEERHLLARLGWEPIMTEPRMLRGEAVEWKPSLIWSILGFAFG